MIAAIVLAAGKSRRMGTQKLLLPVEGKPLIVHIIGEVLHSKVEPVYVVVSPESAAVREALASLPVTPVVNPLPDGDMLSSVRCGLRAMPAACDRFLLVLGDQPGITAELVSQLIAEAKTDGKSLIVPVCQGRRGHPVLIDMKYRDEILNSYDGTGLRGLFQAHPGEIEEVPVNDPLTLEDMDRPEDYERIVRRDRQFEESPGAPDT